MNLWSTCMPSVHDFKGQSSLLGLNLVKQRTSIRLGTAPRCPLFSDIAEKSVVLVVLAKICHFHASKVPFSFRLLEMQTLREILKFYEISKNTNTYVS